MKKSPKPTKLTGYRIRIITLDWEQVEIPLFRSRIPEEEWMTVTRDVTTRVAYLFQSGKKIRSYTREMEVKNVAS